MSGIDETAVQDDGFDRVLGFTVPGRNARGRAIRLGPVLDTILAAHAYPDAIRHLLAEALVITAVMGSLLKHEKSQLTLQAQAQGGVVDLMVCDYLDGELRGYVSFDETKLAAVGSNPSLSTLFGEGYLAFTYDLAAKDERYQGIVPLEGTSMAAACESYFARSEQLPTLMRVAVRTRGERCVAGGLLVQHYPEGEEGGERLHVKENELEWEHVAVIAGSVRHDELLAGDLSLEQLVWRLFHEEDEVRVMPMAALSRGCRCSAAYYESILSKFPEAERADMRSDEGVIEVDCEFCAKTFPISL
ncbi:Hsp33 family molecular chaperone HslO [Novosphingobium marinum]|uniref:Molecular chaperone Hsp33 n=1 Tax=Novosphingobium marinum TaxID=1514948 RepID=A0A7Z0BU15_9SPHN|nr:molecular chaperone Hsp33 [Novosphingobium marinum]